jgi:hypothetical protein
MSVEAETPMWTAAALAWATAAGFGVPFVGCWTGRWRSLATGHTGQAWNTLFPGLAAGSALLGVSFATGWAWPGLLGLAMVVVGMVLYLATAFSDRTLLEPTWLREQRREHRDPHPRRGFRW